MLANSSKSFKYGLLLFYYKAKVHIDVYLCKQTRLSKQKTLFKKYTLYTYSYYIKRCCLSF